MIPVSVNSLSLSNMGFVVLLKGQKDERTLPIFIGAPEAQAIVLPLNSVKPPRPLTHDLLKSFLDVLECRVERVEVCDLQEGTFFGRIVLAFEGQELAVDSRPSDAIALALRCHVPIVVAEHVMASAGVVMKDDDEKEGNLEAKTASKKATDPLAERQQQLQRAIQEERYEDAARLRDEIRRLSSTC
jgi:bifunctional DNase/RNase